MFFFINDLFVYSRAIQQLPGPGRGGRAGAERARGGRGQATAAARGEPRRALSAAAGHRR